MHLIELGKSRKYRVDGILQMAEIVYLWAVYYYFAKHFMNVWYNKILWQTKRAW